VTINKSVVIEGLAGATIVAANNNMDTVTIEANDVTIKGVEVNGGRRAVHVDDDSEDVLLCELLVQDASNVGILVDPGCIGFTLLDSEIRRCDNDGVRILSDRVSLERNNSHRNQGNGYRLDDTDTASFFLNRSFQNHIHGFRLEGSNFEFVDNVSIRCRLRGFVIEGDHHMFINNLARENGSHGYSLDAATDCELFDNRARFNGGHGFRVINSMGNILDDLNSTGNSGHGILMLMSFDNSIINSFVFQNERSGVLLNGSTMFNSVSENVIRENLEFGIGEFGDNAIGDNIIRDNGQD